MSARIRRDLEKCATHPGWQGVVAHWLLNRFGGEQG